MEKIGPYILRKKLGKGAMGVVYLAQEEQSGRKVALKVLFSRLARDREYIARFQREARAVTVLKHPNIVRGLDVGTDGDRPYLAMEYVSGLTLDQALEERGRLSENHAIDLGIALARALAHIHRFGFIHRDIKPQNVIIARDGTPKLADLGLARQESDASVTRTGLALGTPFYISPEQAKGRKDVDIRSDLYSLGATLFHLATGEPPYTGPTPAAVMREHLRAAIPDPRHLRPKLSRPFSRIIMRLLQKQPDDRYADPELLLAALEKLPRQPDPVKTAPAKEKEREKEPKEKREARKEPEKEQAPPPPERPARRHRRPARTARRRSRAPLALVGVLLFLGGLAGTLFLVYQFREEIFGAGPVPTPTAVTTVRPTPSASAAPTLVAGVTPSAAPTASAEPTSVASAAPTGEPTLEPTGEPTAEPTLAATGTPTPSPPPELGPEEIAELSARLRARVAILLEAGQFLAAFDELDLFLLDQEQAGRFSELLEDLTLEIEARQDDALADLRREKQALIRQRRFREAIERFQDLADRGGDRLADACQDDLDELEEMVEAHRRSRQRIVEQELARAEADIEDEVADRRYGPAAAILAAFLEARQPEDLEPEREAELSARQAELATLGELWNLVRVALLNKRGQVIRFRGVSDRLEEFAGDDLDLARRSRRSIWEMMAEDLDDLLGPDWTPERMAAFASWLKAEDRAEEATALLRIIPEPTPTAAPTAAPTPGETAVASATPVASPPPGPTAVASATPAASPSPTAPAPVTGSLVAPGRGPPPTVSKLQGGTTKAITQAVAADGVGTYVNRPQYRLAQLPPALAGTVLIQTDINDGKIADRSNFLFVDRPARVYVAYDTRPPGVPAWLGRFTRTGTTVTFVAQGRSIPMTVFWRDFPAGRIELGPNDDEGQPASNHPQSPALNNPVRWHVMYFAFVGAGG